MSTVKGVSVENIVDNSFVDRGEFGSWLMTIVDEVEVII